MERLQGRSSLQLVMVVAGVGGGGMVLGSGSYFSAALTAQEKKIKGERIYISGIPGQAQCQHQKFQHFAAMCVCVCVSVSGVFRGAEGSVSGPEWLRGHKSESVVETDSNDDASEGGNSGNSGKSGSCGEKPAVEAVTLFAPGKAEAHATRSLTFRGGGWDASQLSGKFFLIIQWLAERLDFFETGGNKNAVRIDRAAEWEWSLIDLHDWILRNQFKY